MTTNELETLGLTDLPVVKDVFVAQDQSALALIFANRRCPDCRDGGADIHCVRCAGRGWLRGEVVWATDADCCSETWFADVINLAALIDHPITAASLEWLDEDPDDGSRSRQECDEVQALTLTTTAGDCRIEFRNSSNGYYGGSIYLVDSGDSLAGFWRVTHDTSW